MPAMRSLRPCPSCRRHIRVEESACPFCATPVALSAAPVATPRGRLTRAAVFAAGAAIARTGCGSSKTETGGSPPPPPAQVDAEPIAAEPDAAPAVAPPAHHNIPKPYGAPPARKRLV
jgi:hypothetical protein